MRTLIPLLLFLCCFPTNAYAQAKLQGRLTTETGQAVPFVELVPNNGQVTRTKEDGSFLIRFHASVNASDSTTIRVSNGWIICSQYRGRFVTIPESYTESIQVTVAPRGSGCVLTSENFTSLMGEVVESRVKLDLTLGQGGQRTAESDVGRKLKHELAIKLAMLSVLEGYSEETGVPLATIQKEMNGWAHRKDPKDTDLGRAAKALYLGDWSQAEVLAGVSMKNESARISELKKIGDEVKKKILEGVRAFVSGAHFKFASQIQQGKVAEVLKTVEEVDGFFVRQVSKEEFKEEWALSRVLVGGVRMQVVLIKLMRTSPAVPDDVASLIAQAIADQEEAIRALDEKRMPDMQAVARLMVGVIHFISRETVQGEEKARRLSRALESVDAASNFIRQPAPANCECEQQAQLQYFLTIVYAGIGGDIGGEQGALLIRKAESISEEGLSRSTDKTSRGMWVQAQRVIGDMLLRPNAEGPESASDAQASIVFLEKTLARVNKEDLPGEWAQIKAGLATAYLRLADVGGVDPARNLDAAVKAYDQASEVLAKHGPKEHWDYTQFMLGFALMRAGMQAGGDDGRAKLARAVKINEELLTFHKGRETQYQWPLIKLNLGRSLRALGERLPGEEGVAKLLAAEAVLKEALASFTPNRRFNWGETQGDLGAVHLSLANAVKPDAAKHLAAAVKAFEAGLAAMPSDAPLMVRGWMKNSLGGALLGLGQLPGPESERHLTHAVEVLKSTLPAASEKGSREQWVVNYLNLGSAFLTLGVNFEKDRERNLREAVATYEKALTVVSEKETPKEWSQIMGSLGLARLNLGQMVEHEAEVNLSASVTAYEKVLTAVPEKNVKGEWGQYSANLAVALLTLGQRFERDREAHLVRALKIFKEVIPLHDEKESSEQWAQLQSHTGQTLLLLAQSVEDKRETRLADSIAAFRRALPVLTTKGPPYEAARAEAELGLALLTLGTNQGPEGARSLTKAVEAFDRALAIYAGKQFEWEHASAQLNRGAALLLLGRLTEGEEGHRRLAAALAAGEEASAFYKVDATPGAWADAINLIAEAQLGLDRPEAAAKGFARVLAVDPTNLRALSNLNYIYHEIFFDYDEAFRLQQQWVRLDPDMVEAEADYAEKHFTTKRFPECERRIAALLRRKELAANIEIALRMIQIANLVGLGKPESVGSKMDSLIEAVKAQTPAFEVSWIFNGTTHFISNDERFAKHRAQLLQMFAAGKAGQRDKIIDEMRKVRADFNE
jgi:tetratricopeptide (TPR) repeat protein